MKVREIMTSEVITANLRDGLYQTWERMYERSIRHMPVLDDDGKVCGMISDRDVRRPGWVDSPNHSHAFAIDNRTHVESAMSEGVLSVVADDPLARAIDLLVEHRVGALPVFEDDKLVGMLSAVDVLRAFRDRLAG